jgi:hypothetical protein
MPFAAIGLGCEKENFCDNQCHQSQRPQGTHIQIPLNIGCAQPIRDFRSSKGEALTFKMYQSIDAGISKRLAWR